jgi:carbamoyltransferase
MTVVGFSEGFHDAAISLVKGDRIVYASHSERYSKVKNDKWLHKQQLKSCNMKGMINNRTVAFHEKRWLKNTRRLYSGKAWKNDNTTVEYDKSFYHHQSHAAAGYYTAPFDDCNILVIDSIGEWDTISIWDNMKKIKSWKYPYSLGLLYSAITQRIGLKPNEDEYITMGMAAYGEPIYDMEYLLQQNNHFGVGNIFPSAKNEDLAASVQALYEKKLLELVAMCPKKNLIIMGGCALNCKANSLIKDKNIWILPSPGDAGNAIGAAALVNKKKLKWIDPYLGFFILNAINPKDVVKELLKNKVCGVANGSAEFGPRALGNRSLLGDPRYDIKDTVNDIKRRQKFRPFAPAILEEYADEYFDGPMNRYMQFVAKAKHDYSSVTHVDGTARVQLVEKDCQSIIRPILEEWYDETGCPMLLNTSLNIKGQPIVNDWNDAKNFMEKYNVAVF